MGKDIVTTTEEKLEVCRTFIKVMDLLRRNVKSTDFKHVTEVIKGIKDTEIKDVEIIRVEVSEDKQKPSYYIDFYYKLHDPDMSDIICTVRLENKQLLMSNRVEYCSGWDNDIIFTSYPCGEYLLIFE